MKRVAVLLICVACVSCGRSDDPTADGKAVSVAMATGEPVDPDLEAQRSKEYARNVEERRKREASFGDPLAEIKQDRESGRQLVLGGRFEASMNFVVSLWRNDTLLCSGSLVKPDVVVTAWHCLCSPLSPSRFQPPTEIRIGPLGRLPLEAIPVSSVSPSHCPRDKTKKDVATLYLARSPKPDTEIIYPIPRESVPETLPAVVVLGFGFRTDGGSSRRELGVVTIASRDCSTQKDQMNYRCLARQEFVAIDPLGKVDACNGDSGGPALIPFDLPPNSINIDERLRDFFQPRYELIGVVSRGLTDRCGSGTVYSKIAGLPVSEN